MDSIICLPLFMQKIPWALVLDLAKAGRSIPARMAMIAITTSSSISVKPSVVFAGANALGRVGLE